jgi:hypothetical protein
MNADEVDITKCESIQQGLEMLGYEADQERAVYKKGTSEIPFADLSKHTVRSMAEKLRREKEG